MSSTFPQEYYRSHLLGSAPISVAALRPLLRNENNPRTDNTSPNDMTFSLADREAKVVILFDNAEKAVTATDSVYRVRYQ